MQGSGKVRRWGYRCLLAAELTVLLLLIAGGCYSKQNYHVLSPQAGDDLLSKCNVVVEGHIVSVEQWNRTSWTQKIFFCFSFDETPAGPTRYNVSIVVDKVLKGDPDMPRNIRIRDCRPLTADESSIFANQFFPNDLPVRVGYNHKFGDKFRNLIVAPLEAATVPATQPASGRIPSPGRRH